MTQKPGKKRKNRLDNIRLWWNGLKTPEKVALISVFGGLITVIATGIISSVFSAPPVNHPPIIERLYPDIPSPQISGFTTKWVAVASDSDNDQIYYKFWLKGPLDPDFRAMTGWIINDAWAWTSSKPDKGVYLVEVWVRDLKHSNADWRDDYGVSNNYTIISPIASYPENVDDWLNEGWLYFNNQSYEESYAFFNKATELYPQDSGAWAGKGFILNKMNEIDGALVCFNRSVDLNDKNAGAWIGKGWCLMQLGKYDASLSSFDKAISLTSEEIDTQNYINALDGKAAALKHLNRTGEADVISEKVQSILNRYPQYA
jgi:tetratricopeptide (TPR) repeat protein